MLAVLLARAAAAMVAAVALAAAAVVAAGVVAVGLAVAAGQTWLSSRLFQNAEACLMMRQTRRLLPNAPVAGWAASAAAEAEAAPR